MSDMQEAVWRCQQGQLDAFTALFKLYQSHVFDLACVILRDEAAAEGAVHDTLLAVFQKIGALILS